MPEADHTPNPNSSTRPFPNGEEGTVIDREYLIRQAFAVDTRRGYECLFRRYYKVLCTQAIRYTYSRDVAEDIVAEVFLGFWKNQVHEHITSSYRAYLYRAFRNRVHNHLQDEFRRDNSIGKPVDLDMVEEVNYEDPQRIIQFTELYQRLETEIKRLPPQCQRVFVLSRFDGKKNREIAQELHISIKGVEANIQRALLQLKKVLDVGLFVWAIGWLTR